MKLLGWSKGYNDYQISVFKSDESFQWLPGFHEGGREMPSSCTNHMEITYTVWTWLWWKFSWFRGHYDYYKFWDERNPTRKA